MIVRKSCLNILIWILFYTSRVNGQLAINLPASGIYLKATEMNCTDSSFDVTNGYTWFKDSNVIYDTDTGVTTGKYTSTHGTGYFTLVITNTALDDNGIYRCNYNFQDATDTLEIQAKGTGHGKLHDGSLTVTITGLYPGTTTVSSVLGNRMTFPGTQTIKSVADLFEIEWTSSSASIDNDNVKDGCDVTIQSLTTYVIHVDVERSTTTSPPTTSSSSTSTTSTTANPPTTTEIPCDRTCIITVSIFVPLGVIMLIFCCICCWLRCRRNNKKKDSSKNINSNQS